MKLKKKIIIISLIITLTIVLTIGLLLLTGYTKEDLRAKTITGTITEMPEECGRTRKYINGEVVIKSYGQGCIQDSSGGYVIIDDKLHISTSSGFTGDPETTWGVSLKNLNPGDKVEVRYIPPSKNDSGKTSCRSCYVKLAND